MATYKLQPIIAGPAVAPLDASEAVGNRIRSVGSSAPVTTGWIASDLWADTINEGSTGIIFRRWTGTAFIPARGGGGGGTAPLMTDLFTLSDGAVWSTSNWALGVEPTTGTGFGATVLSSQGKLTTSNTGGYAGTARISRRANIGTQTDVNFSFTFKFDSTECFPQVAIRSTTAAIDSQSGYYLSLAKGTWSVNKRSSYVGTDLSASIPYGFSVGTLYTARFRVVGSTIQARVWLSTDAEPSVWGYSGTDTTYTGAGYTGFTLAGGSAASVSNFFVDNVTIESS